MSVFSTINVGAPLDQKKRLLAKLMQQMQEASGRASGLAGVAQGFSSAPVVPGVGMRTPHPIGGGANLTHGQPTLAPGLLKLLGPGGTGSPIPGRDFSAAPGMPVAPGLGSNPHGAPPPFGGGLPPIPMPSPGQGLPVPTPAPGGNAAAAPGSSQLIPLGNGVAYDPVNDVLIRRPTAAGGAGSGVGTGVANGAGGGARALAA